MDWYTHLPVNTEFTPYIATKYDFFFENDPYHGPPKYLFNFPNQTLILISMFMDADQIKLTMSKKLRKKDYILHFIKLFFFL